ncbi:MAG: 3-hydroxyacyl-CoA dehydrogenase NAD-binding domain-containing protein [Candidatus Methylomirabilales bacterium]
MEGTFQHFKTRLLDNGVLIVGFDYQGKSVNVLSAEALREFTALVNHVAADQRVKGIVLVSLKGSFIAGADVNEIYEITDHETCKTFVTETHTLFARIEKDQKPWVVAIDGLCLGGGLELALACQWRVATDKAVLGLPEVKLGIIPGFGGTQRLPRLIGLPDALDLITSGKNIYAYPAHKRGVIDDLVVNQSGERTIDTIEKEAFVTVAIQRALEFCSQPRRRRIRKTKFIQKMLGWPGVRDCITFPKARKMINARVKNHYPAPVKAVDAIQMGLRMPVQRACLEAEMPRLLELVVSRLSKDLIAILLCTQKMKQQKRGSPFFDPAKHSIGVLGAGLMGAQIAGEISDQGFRVTLKDLEPKFLCAGMNRITKIKKDDLAKKIIKQPEFEMRLLKIHPTLSWEDFRTTPFVIEAIKEVLPWKQQLLEEFEGVVSAEAVFATNTSSFTVSEIAEKARQKERCVGMHFFNPVRKMQLVEIVQADFTSPEALAKAVEVTGVIGKLPLVVRDGPGFLVNRILSRYLIEAVLLVAEGISMTDIDTAAEDFGMAIDSGRPMGPLAVIDYVGVETAMHVLQSLRKLGDRIAIHPLVADMAPAGKKPLTFWTEGKENDDVRQIVRAKYAGEPRAISREQLTTRLMLPMRDEALRCLQEGIVAEPWQVDLAMLYGAGFPAFRGGLLKEMARDGVDPTRADLERLMGEYGDRFQPSEYFKEAEGLLSRYKN